MRCFPALLLTGILLPFHMASAAKEIEVVITFQNLSTEALTLSSPWLGFQDGGFDIYDPAFGPSEALLQLIRFGDSSELTAELTASGHGRLIAELPVAGGILAAGEKASLTLCLDSEDEGSQFLVFAAKLGVYGTSFVASESPVAHPLFDESGSFTGTSFLITASEVRAPQDEIGAAGGPSAPEAVPDEDSSAREEVLNDDLEEISAGFKRNPSVEGYEALSASGIGDLELARITVRAVSREESGHLGLDGASTPFGEADGATTTGGEETPETSIYGEATAVTGVEPLDDLDLDRWERYAESLD
ncbi:MAG: hypothetical protein KDD47_11645, partial [Acidobacteria bacterium]|nr:hypothetical protein [Acidobacteriota bacterium]